MQETLETWAWYLDQEDPLEEGMALQSSILAWRIPWTEGSGGLQSIGLRRVRCDWRNLTHTHIHSSNLTLTLHISSVQSSCSVVSDSLWPHESQDTRPPCPSPTPGVYSNSCPSSRWCHPAISPLSSPSPPAPHLSQHQGLLQWVNSLHDVAKVLEFQLQHQSFQWTPRTDLL